MVEDQNREMSYEEMNKDMLSADPSGIKSAQMATHFMFAMQHYHEKMKLHITLHPVFFLAGFLTAYAIF